MAGLMMDITAKMNNFRAILPRATAKDIAESFMFAAVKDKAAEYSLLSKEVRIDAKKWLIIEGHWFMIQDVGPCCPVRVLVDQDGNFKFQVHYVTLESGHYDDKSLDDILKQMSSKEYVVCAGFKDQYVDIKDTLTDHYTPLKLREWPGSIRYDSVDCKLSWCKTSVPNKYRGMRNICQPCNSLLCSMRKSKKRAESRTDGADPPKCMNLKYMRPDVRRKVLQKKAKEIKDLTKKLKKYENSENASQDNETVGPLISMTTKSKNKSVTSTTKSVISTPISLSGKDTLRTVGTTDRDDHDTSVGNNGKSVTKEALNKTQFKKVTSKRKKMVTAAGKNNTDNAPASAERSNDIAEIVQKTKITGKKRKPEWMGVVVQNYSVVTPIDENIATASAKKGREMSEVLATENKNTVDVTISNESISTANKQKKTRARRRNQKSEALDKRSKDTVVEAGEAIKDRLQGATLGGEITNSLVNDNDKATDGQTEDIVEKNQDNMATSAEKIKDKGTILEEEVTYETSQVAIVEAYDNAITCTEESKEDIPSVIYESNGHDGNEIIRYTEKKEENIPSSIITSNNMVTEPSERNSLKTEKAVENSYQITTTKNGDETVNQTENNNVSSTLNICSAPPVNKLIDTVFSSPEQVVGDNVVVKNEDYSIVLAADDQAVNEAEALGNLDSVASAKELRHLEFASFAQDVDAASFEYTNLPVVDTDQGITAMPALKNINLANRLINSECISPARGISMTSDVKAEDVSAVPVKNSKGFFANKTQDINAVRALKNMDVLPETIDITKDTASSSAKNIRDKFAMFAKKVKEKGTQRAIRRSVYPATSPVARGVTWQWEADVLGKWNDFDIDVATHLEENMNKNVTFVDLTTSMFHLPYHIDLNQMTQTRVNTGRTRKIRQAFTSMSYPPDTGQSGASAQNGVKRKTVINKAASLKKSKTVSSSASATPGFVPPHQNLPHNGIIFPNFPSTQGSNSQPPSLQGGNSQMPVTGSQQQGPLTRNKYQQVMTGFSSQTPTGNQTSTSSSLPGTSSSIFGNSSNTNPISLPPGSHSMFGSWHTPTTLPYMPGTPSSSKSQTSGISQISGFGLQPPGFLSFLNLPTSHAGNQPGFSFGSQPIPMSFNPSSLLGRSGRSSRVRPSNPGASSISSTVPGQPAPNFQQSPFQTASATVPSAAPFPNHARIPNNVPKGSKGGKHVLSADDILHNYVNIVAAPPANDDCCICYEKLIEASGQGTGGSHDRTVLQLERCSHMFHKLCLDALFNSGPKDGSLQCPSCKTIYGEKMGNCPRGEMEYLVMHHRLAGYEDCNSIQILYHIQSGTQGPEHPHPGQRYSTRGFPRIGYLPNNDKGRKVLQLLIVAWKRRLTFTIGTSTTTGEGDTVTWNEIHHKTEHTSNYSGHGYPDPKYLDNVLLELAVHGITEKDLPT